MFDKKNIKFNLFVLISSSTGQAIFKIITLSILARLLTPIEFGVYSASVVVIGLIVLINEIGVHAAIIQKKTISKNTLETSRIISLFVGGTFFVVTFISSNLISDLFGIAELKFVIKLISIIFLIESTNITSRAILSRNHNFKIIALVEFSSYLFGFVFVSILLAYLGFSYLALILGIIYHTFIKSVVYLIYDNNIYGSYNYNELLSLLSFGGGFTISRVLNYLALNSDNFNVSRYIGAEGLGIYGRAYQIMVMPATLIGGALDRIYFSAFSDYNRTDIKKGKNIFIESLNTIHKIAGVIAIIIFINSEIIVLILLGGNWLSVINPLKILTIGLVFRMAYKINISVIRANGKIYTYSISQLIYFIIVFIGTYYTVSLGLSYVALVVTASIFINYIITGIIANKILMIKFKEYNKVLKTIISMILFILFMWFINILLINLSLSIYWLNIPILFISLLLIYKDENIKSLLLKLNK